MDGALSINGEQVHNPVEIFFEYLANNRYQEAFSLLHPDVVFEAQSPNTIPVYGKFRGLGGVKQFFTNIPELFLNQNLKIGTVSE